MGVKPLELLLPPASAAGLPGASAMLPLVTLLPLLPVLLLLPPVLSFIFSTSRATSASIARLSWASTSVISTFSSLLLPLASLLPTAAGGRLLLLLPEPAAVGLFNAALSEATAAALSAASEAFLLLALLLLLEAPLMGSALGLGAPGTGEGGGVLDGASLLLLLLPFWSLVALLLLLLMGESASSGCTGASLLAAAAVGSRVVSVVERDVVRVSLQARVQGSAASQDNQSNDILFGGLCTYCRPPAFNHSNAGCTLLLQSTVSFLHVEAPCMFSTCTAAQAKQSLLKGEVSCMMHDTSAANDPATLSAPHLSSRLFSSAMACNSCMNSSLS